MKFAPACAILCLFFPQAGFTATYISGFEAPTYNHALDLAGQDGWAINDATGNLSAFSLWNGSYAGYLGGLYSSPSILNVDLTHSFSTPVAGTVFDVDFDIEGSSTTYPNRDAFGWSFKSGPVDVLRVAFEPGLPTRMEVAWYDSANVRHLLTPVSQDIFYNGKYHLQVSFSSSGVDALFNATLTGANSFSWNGTLPGAGSSNFTAFGADFDVLGATGADAGDNFMLFDGLSIANAIPEPASSFLGAALAAGLLLRRFRRN